MMKREREDERQVHVIAENTRKDEPTSLKRRRRKNERRTKLT